MSKQLDFYDENYEELLSELTALADEAIGGSFSSTRMTNIVNYLTDKYAEYFLAEINYVLDNIDFDLTGVEINNIRNKVDPSNFYRSNRRRIAEILSRRVQEIIALKDELEGEELKQRSRNMILQIATSELHMAIEKASVNSVKVIQEVSGDKLYKTWNAVLDKKTCVICKSLHGVTIPVDESFSDTNEGRPYREQLSYVGGDLPYAHPRCRCWFTYSRKNEKPI